LFQGIYRFFPASHIQTFSPPAFINKYALFDKSGISEIESVQVKFLFSAAVVLSDHLL